MPLRDVLKDRSSEHGNDAIQGVWVQDSCEIHISGERVSVNKKDYGEIKLMSDSLVSLKQDGELIYGMLKGETEMTWSDGDVWKRVSPVLPKEARKENASTGVPKTAPQVCTEVPKPAPQFSPHTAAGPPAAQSPMMMGMVMTDSGPMMVPMMMPSPSAAAQSPMMMQMPQMSAQALMQPMMPKASMGSMACPDPAMAAMASMMAAASSGACPGGYAPGTTRDWESWGSGGSGNKKKRKADNSSVWVPEGYWDDWICPNCSNLNYASKEICNTRSCRRPRPDETRGKNQKFKWNEALNQWEEDPDISFEQAAKRFEGAGPSSQFDFSASWQHSLGSSMVAFDPAPCDPAWKKEIDAFLQEWGIDGKAADVFRSESREVQQLSMAKGMSGAKNPSGALLGRVRDAKKEVKIMAMKDPLIEEYVKENCVGLSFKPELYKLSREERDLVMARGVIGARTPSAALLARIREAKATVSEKRDHMAAMGVELPEGSSGLMLPSDMPLDAAGSSGIADAFPPELPAIGDIPNNSRHPLDGWQSG